MFFVEGKMNEESNTEDSIVKTVDVYLPENWPEHIAPLCWLTEFDNEKKELFYMGYVWKKTNTAFVIQDINSRGEFSPFSNIQEIVKGYESDELIIGYDPLNDDQRNVFHVCVSKIDADIVVSNLEQLHRLYSSKIKNRKNCESRVWKSFGSEQEIQQETLQSTREFISYEWICKVSSRRKKHLENSENSGNKNNQMFVVKKMDCSGDFKLLERETVDKSIWVNVAVVHASTQTNRECPYADIINGTDTNDFEKEINFEQEIVSNNCKYEGDLRDDIFRSEKSPDHRDSDEKMTELGFSYFKTFLNIHTAQPEKVLCVAWNPLLSGILAVAYGCCKSDFQKARRAMKNDKILPDKRNLNFIETADVKFENSIFNEFQKTNSRRIYSTNEEDDEIYPISSIKQVGQTIFENPKLIPDEPPLASDSDEIVAENTNGNISFEKYLTEIIHDDEINENNGKLCLKDLSSFQYADILSDYSESEPESISSNDESEPSIIIDKAALAKIPLYGGDEFSDVIFENLETPPVLDTNSSILIWNVENELQPQAKLMNCMEVNFIQFCPYEAEILAGCDSSGHLIIWIVEFNELKSKNYLPNKFFSGKNEDYVIIYYPVVISDQTISHKEAVTHLQWMHPSLNVKDNGLIEEINKEKNNNDIMQIFTSSFDGTIKIWNLIRNNSHPENTREMEVTQTINLELTLLQTIEITNPKLETNLIPICQFMLDVPNLRYFRKITQIGGKTNNYLYQCDTTISDSFSQRIIISTITGELGIVAWEKQHQSSIISSAQIKCKHNVWWSQVHDDQISSISRNKIFPSIFLTTGGHILALWNINYEGGPIWSHYYRDGFKIKGGDFSQSNPAILQILLDNGRIEVWNIFKKIHQPVWSINSSGRQFKIFSNPISTLDDADFGVANANGAFQLIKINRNEQFCELIIKESQLKEIGKLFEKMTKSKLEMVKWNRALDKKTDDASSSYLNHEKSNHIGKFFKLNLQKGEGNKIEKKSSYLKNEGLDLQNLMNLEKFQKLVQSDIKSFFHDLKQVDEILQKELKSSEREKETDNSVLPEISKNFIRLFGQDYLGNKNELLESIENYKPTVVDDISETYWKYNFLKSAPKTKDHVTGRKNSA